MSSIKIIVLLSIVLSLNRTFKVQYKLGQYQIEDSAQKITNMQKYKVKFDTQFLSIEGVCSTQTAGYIVWDGNMRVESWIPTQRKCNEDGDEVIKKLLSSSSKISVQGGKVYLYNSEGQRMLKLRKTV